ncbi:hypothetical protein M513_05201 [Trichuris suis]|uniref:Uncharacterized protein n=1 Tax=Trichuris suis TaxID=68888 RepID=A0A085M9N8_9BILA|nr:hypothetical protein M513_05201 [Trichuris suis]
MAKNHVMKKLELENPVPSISAHSDIHPRSPRIHDLEVIFQTSMAAALTKCRNRMDVATRGDLRLSLSNLEPDIMKLAKKRQPQGSH